VKWLVRSENIVVIGEPGTLLARLKSIGRQGIKFPSGNSCCVGQSLLPNQPLEFAWSQTMTRLFFQNKTGLLPALLV
jgi:hypothetical protein